MSVDLSFIRLKPTLSEALRTDRYTNSEFVSNDSIRLSPNETYLQITNLADGFSFDGNYDVWVITPCGEELQDITENVLISEFVATNGTQQFSFEIVNTGVDHYYREVCLKFVHTVSDSVLYSNPFLITDYMNHETVRFDYRDYGVFEGVDYTNANKYQSIRLVGYYQNPTDDTEVKNYYQMSTSNTVSSRSMIKKGANYLANKINAFTYERYNFMLNHNVIYINGERITNKTIIKSAERQGLTNWQASSFTVYLNPNDTYNAPLQIFGDWVFVSYEPFDILTPQV